jgi:hypothetical protein
LTVSKSPASAAAINALRDFVFAGTSSRAEVSSSASLSTRAWARRSISNAM